MDARVFDEVREPEPRNLPRLGLFYPTDAASRRRLTQLVDECHAFTWRALRRLGVPRADADDATQEVFMVLARRLDQVEAGRERAFLFATALRVASTRRRSARRRPEQAAPSLDECVAAGLDPEELSELASARPVLAEILDGMPLELRAVFVLYELEELSVPAIAELLSTPRGTISFRLKAAREAFQAAVRRQSAREAFRGRVR